MPMIAHAQRGVALLTILLLVVSITVVAGAMLASQKISIRRSGLLFDQNQLLQDINAGQQLAVALVRVDSQLNDTDSEQDVWAQPIPPYALANHSVGVELRDEASRFNLNNLYHDGAVDDEALAVFQRLLTQLDLEPDIAIALLDFQDTDHEVYQDGGDEQVVYTQSSSASALSTLPNQALVSIDQLQEIEGVTAETLSVLRPYIAAVPYYVPININTASPVLLAALVDGGTDQQMQVLVDMREKQALASIDDLWQLPILSNLDQQQRQALTPLLAVESQAFRALITVSDDARTGPVRQRFATVLLSKTASEDTQASRGSSTDANSNKSAKEVKVMAQRLWAFRPSF